MAWAYLALLAAEMAASEMAATMGIHVWSPAEVALTLVMWIVMMVGMMVPTALPFFRIFAAVARKGGEPAAVAGWLVVGYVATWSGFSVAATLAQWGLDTLALLSPMMVTNSALLAGALLVGAGFYQLTPQKDACLQRCRDPARFIAEHWRKGRVGALRMGMAHGAYCVGCCWFIMALLFVGGVMNLIWIAVLTAFVLLEKLAPPGQAIRIGAGVTMVLAGVAYPVWLLSA